MNNERTYSEEELHADQFAAYYAETEDIYGDDLESAYNDFMNFSNGEAEEEMYSEEDENEMAELFADFYTENVDVYGDTEEGAEEAYADFMELVESEEMYSEEVSFEDFYAETYDIYGENLEEAYADFVEFTEGEEENEDEYGVKDFFKKVGSKIKANVGEGGKLDKWIDKTGEKLRKHNLNSPYGSHRAFSAADEYSDENELDLDVFSDNFATYYAENEDLYGDSDEGLEEAYDDFADIAAEYALEDALEAQYSAYDSEYSRLGDAYGKVKSAATGRTAKATGVGALAGAGLGLAGGLIAGNVGADAKERKALKLKARSGSLTSSEKARYAELKSARRKKIAMATGAGAVVGGAAGAYALKSGRVDAMHAGVARAKDAKDMSKVFGSNAVMANVDGARGFFDGYKNKRAEQKEVAKNAKDTRQSASDVVDSATKDKTFSAIDLLGTPGTKVNSFGLNKTVTKSEDKTFSDAGVEAPKSLVLGILGK